MKEPLRTQQERRHFSGAAKRIAAITLCSRVAGLIRDMVMSRSFGASRVTEAFYLAFIIPNLFRRLFGEGALSAAFVPILRRSSVGTIWYWPEGPPAESLDFRRDREKVLPFHRQRRVAVPPGELLHQDHDTGSIDRTESDEYPD